MTGLERIRGVFDQAKKDGRAVLIPYFVAGYPDLETSKRLIHDAVDAGADIIELGIPFSDPVADGPTIQGAITKSLENGTRPGDALRLVRQLRSEGVDAPILGMTYANLFYVPGYETAARRLAESGVDGTIVPDIPLEESADYRAAWKKEGLATVLLATPATPNARLKKIAAASTGFLYLVAVYGTTGARDRVADETKQLLERVGRIKDRPPACVGFGVSRPQHVKELKKLGADGVVVGSALVDRIRDGGNVAALVAGLRKAT